MNEHTQHSLRISPWLTPDAVQNLSDIIFVTDNKRHIIFVNRVACEKIELEEADLLGKNIAGLYPKEIQAKYTSKILHSVQKYGGWSGEVELSRADGTFIRVDVKVMSWSDDAGRVAGNIWICRDISDNRLNHMRQQQPAESYLRAVIDSMEDAMYVCDTYGKILLCNDAHCRMLGYSREEIIGDQPRYRWVDSLDERKLQYSWRILLKEGALKNYTIPWHRRDGSVLIVSLAFSTMKDDSGKVTGVVVSARDITDVQYVEELRRTNERMYRLISDVQRKAERLHTLEEVNFMVLKNADIGRIFRSVVGGIRKLVQHDLAGIYVFDSNHECLLPHTLSKQTRFSRKLSKFPLRLGEGIIGAAAISGKMVFVNNAQMDPRSKYPEGMRPEKEHFIAVPLQGRGSIFGVLVVARNSDREFIEEEAMIVKSFADATTVALENVRLVWELNTYQQEITHVSTLQRKNDGHLLGVNLQKKVKRRVTPQRATSQSAPADRGEMK